MGAVPLVAGLAMTAAGTAMQVQAAHDNEAAQNTIIDNQQKAEQARQQSMLLDADRRKRELIRHSIIARSQALTVGTSQGASFGSALPASMGNVSSEASLNLRGVNNAVSLGTDIFNSNQGVLQGRRAEAAAGTLSATGSGLVAMGGKVAGVSGQFGNLTGGFGGE